MKPNWKTIPNQNQKQESKEETASNSPAKDFVQKNKKHLIGAGVSTLAMMMVVGGVSQTNPNGITANLMFPGMPTEETLSEDFAMDEAVEVDLSEMETEETIEEESPVFPSFEEAEETDLEAEINSLFGEEVEEAEVVEEEAETEEAPTSLSDFFSQETEEVVEEESPVFPSFEEEVVETQGEANEFEFKQNTHTVDTSLLQNAEEINEEKIEELHGSAVSDFFSSSDETYLDSEVTSEDIEIKLEETEIDTESVVITSTNSNGKIFDDSNHTEVDDGEVTGTLYKNNGKIPYYLVTEHGKLLYLDTKRNLNSEIGKEITVIYSGDFERFTLEKVLIPNDRRLSQTGPETLILFSIIFSVLAAFFLRRRV